MKKIFFSLCFTWLIILFQACKKETTPVTVYPDASPGSIAVTIDGQRKTFDVNASAVKLNTFLTYQITIKAYDGINPEAAVMELVITNYYNPVTTGLYSESISSTTKIYYTYQPDFYFRPTYIAPFTDSYGTLHGYERAINITELTSSCIKGTFNGTVWFELFGNKSHTLSNGSFNVNL